jgi:hypothetical protein
MSDFHWLFLYHEGKLPVEEHKPRLDCEFVNIGENK